MHVVLGSAAVWNLGQGPGTNAAAFAHAGVPHPPPSPLIGPGVLTGNVEGMEKSTLRHSDRKAGVR